MTYRVRCKRRAKSRERYMGPLVRKYIHEVLGSHTGRLSSLNEWAANWRKLMSRRAWPRISRLDSLNHYDEGWKAAWLMMHPGQARAVMKAVRVRVGHILRGTEDAT